MANERRFHYRGCSITTRWAESWWRADTQPKQFTASFSVDSPDAHDSAWQEFPEESFPTSVSAADHAFEIAKESIDRHQRDTALKPR